MNRDFQIVLSELGEKLGLEVLGDGARVVCGVGSPEENGPETLCVVWDAKNLSRIDKSALIVGKPEFFSDGRSGLVSQNPKAELPAVLGFFVPPRPVLKGIHSSAVVSMEAMVSEDAWIGPFCTVESGAVLEDGAILISHVYVGKNVHVGKNTVIEPQVTLLDGTRVGKNCLLHAHCGLGCDGFGFVPGPSGIVKIPQLGNVVIGNDVEIGSCTTIDRGTIGDTVVGDGTKIDNHVQIGHNVRIGRNCIICSMTGIGGSSVVEEGVTVSVQVGITDHVRIGKGAILAGRAGATHDIPPKAIVSGFPARPHNEAKRAQVLSTRLPELYERMKRLERLLGNEKTGDGEK